MGLSVGLGPIAGQVALEGGRTVAETYDDILHLASVADSGGFDSIWFAEHHNTPDSRNPSPIVLMAAVAQVTEHARLGTAMAIAPLQHPLRFAEDCAVADQLSHGRAIIGLGSGWRDEEFELFGIPMSERGTRTDEVARICRSAWDEDRFSFSGRHYRFDNVVVTPKPVGHLPLVLGGAAPAAVRRAGRLGDGFIGTGTPHCGIEHFEEQIAAFDEAARAAGRDPQQLAIGFHVKAWVSPNGAVPMSVRSAIWEEIGLSTSWHAGDLPGGAGELPPMDEELIAERSFFGTPGQVIDQTRPWIEAFPGRDLHILFRIHHPGLVLEEVEPTVRLFGAEVAPGLREIAERCAKVLSSSPSSGGPS